MSVQIQYSEKYSDENFEYRHVILPPDLAKQLPKNKLLVEAEWRQLGVQQSRGWEHYAIHRPEPHILLFRRPHNYEPPPAKQPPLGRPMTRARRREVEKGKEQVAGQEAILAERPISGEGRRGRRGGDEVDTSSTGESKVR